MLTAANCTLVIQLLTVATVSLLAQLAMQLAGLPLGVLMFPSLAPELWTAGRERFSGLGLACEHANLSRYK